MVRTGSHPPFVNGTIRAWHANLALPATWRVPVARARLTVARLPTLIPVRSLLGTHSFWSWKTGLREAYMYIIGRQHSELGVDSYDGSVIYRVQKSVFIVNSYRRWPVMSTITFTPHDVGVSRITATATARSHGLSLPGPAPGRVVERQRGTSRENVAPRDQRGA